MLEHCGKAGRIADLFAGVGPFALRLAERARITAVDSDKEAVAALKRAAETTPGLKPVAAEARDLFRRPLLAAELKPFDCVVFDPPRQGAEAQARALAASAVPVVVAVSCNAATFARDARILADGGYRLTRVTPVDQFLYSPHVEIVAQAGEVDLSCPSGRATSARRWCRRRAAAAPAPAARAPPFSSATSRISLVRIASLNCARSRTGMTNAPGPPITQSSK